MPIYPFNWPEFHAWKNSLKTAANSNIAINDGQKFIVKKDKIYVSRS